MAFWGPRGIVRTAFALLVLGAAPVLAEPAVKPGVSNLRDDINPALRAKLEKHLVEQEKMRSQRLEGSNIRIFKDKRNGIPTFTNRVAKYRAKSNFVELNIKFDPIEVEPTYKKLKVSNDYSVAAVSHLVEKYAQQWKLEPSLVYAVIKAESNFRQDAISSAGARGLMQLMPGTAAEMGVDDPFDPAENIAGGTQYLARMLGLFGDNVELALAAYNAGPQTVINCGRKVPNISETKNYVKIVQRYKAQFEGHTIEPTFVAAAKKPRFDALPKAETPGKTKTIYYLSGLTQPVDKVLDEHPDYYFVQFQGRMWSVPKKFVKEIA